MSTDDKRGEDASDFSEPRSQTEAERLASAVRFTMQDHQRLLRRCDVEDICPSEDLCFDVSTTVRCAPCAIKQSLRHGVEVAHGLPFSPDQYRLQRKLKHAEAQLAELRDAMEQVVYLYGANNAEPEELRNAIGSNVERYLGLTKPQPLSEHYGTRRYPADSVAVGLTSAEIAGKA